MKKVKKYFILFLLLASSTCLRAGEKAYLHLDNSAYFLGDTLRLSAYVMDTDTKRLTEKSKVLYVDVVAPEGYVVEKRIYPLVNGRCAGDVYLRPFLLSGLYEIRAYTRYMQNDGQTNYFSQVIPVYEQVKNGQYSKLVIRKREIRNMDGRKCPIHKGIECVDGASSIMSNSQGKAQIVTASYNASTMMPYGVVTVKLKGQPGEHVSLSVLDGDNFMKDSNKGMVDFVSSAFSYSAPNAGKKYLPEQGITVYGKAGRLIRNSQQESSFEAMAQQELVPTLFLSNGYSQTKTTTDQQGTFATCLGKFMGDAYLQLKFAQLADSSIQTKFVVNEKMSPVLRKYTKDELKWQNTVQMGGRNVSVKHLKQSKSQFSSVRLDLIKEMDRLANEDENVVVSTFPNLKISCGLLVHPYLCKEMGKMGAIEVGNSYWDNETDIPAGKIVNSNFTSITKYKEVILRSDNPACRYYSYLDSGSPASAGEWSVMNSGLALENPLPKRSDYSSMSMYPSLVACMIPDTDHEWEKYLKYNQIPHTRYLKVSGFSSLLPYRLPNYSKLHPEHDYRRTLYWNPDLQLDENGEATIQFYNNGTCKKLHISGEGVSDDGRAIIVK